MSITFSAITHSKNDAPRFVGHAALPDAIARSRDFFVRQYARR